MAVDTSINQGPDKTPPMNAEAERGVLGSILLMNDAINEVADFLRPAHFYSDANQRIYTAIHSLYEDGVHGIDVVTLAEELSRRKELENIGGPQYLHKILESVPHAAHIKYYAEIIQEKFVQRSLIQSCTEILRDAYDPACETDTILQQAEQKIFSILEDQEKTDNFDINSILMDTWDRLNERMAKDEGSITGIPTGFIDFDTKINGFQPSELVILAARPSMGKTALVCNWAEGAARLSQKSVLLFSLEQSRLELAERLLCLQSQVNGHQVRSGDLTDAERDALLKASQEISELPIYIDDKPGRTVAQISAIARRIKRRDSLGIIIIDYLQLLEPEDKNQPREQQIAQMSRRLKFLAKELSVPVIALAQLNRGVELREDKRPRLADLRESGAIEQDADLVCFLHRPDAYDAEDSPGLAEVIIAKHRSGPTGIIPLTWRAQYMRFENFQSDTNLPDDDF